MRQRNFVLFTASEDEKTLWLFAFKTIIKENQKHQKELEMEQETARKFKRLTPLEKANILQKSYKVKQELLSKKVEKQEIIRTINKLISEEVEKFCGDSDARQETELKE